MMTLVRRLGVGVVLFLAVAACDATPGVGGVPGALRMSGHRVVAPMLLRPQLAMARLRTANSPSKRVTDLIVVKLGAKHDRVVSAGSAAAWSPDGRRIAFGRVTSRERRGPHGFPYVNHEIFTVNANGSGRRQLTHTSDAGTPVWSPDGREIVFSRERFYVSSSQQTWGITASMWAIHPDGTGLRRLTPTAAGQDDEPGSFSPNGDLLAFTRTEPAPPDGLVPNTSSVYLLNLRNGNARKLTGQSSGPSFSPDGRSIALSSTIDHNGTHQTGEDSEAYAGELYLVDLTGHRRRRLTRTKEIDEESPSFSPNGKRIAYVRTDSIQTATADDNYHHTIFQINPDGSCPTALRDDLTDKFEYFAPTWRPGNSQTESGPLRCHQA
jgi:Tol biopolymer transport system component